MNSCLTNYITSKFKSIGGGKWQAGSGNIYYNEGYGFSPSHWPLFTSNGSILTTALFFALQKPLGHHLPLNRWFEPFSRSPLECTPPLNPILCEIEMLFS